MTFFKRISGLTLISNQILQKGTARMAAVLFPGLITFHCSLLMSQLFLSSHNYTVFICSSKLWTNTGAEPCLHIGDVCCAMVLQRKSISNLFFFFFMEISAQHAFFSDKGMGQKIKKKIQHSVFKANCLFCFYYWLILCKIQSFCNYLESPTGIFFNATTSTGT